MLLTPIAQGECAPTAIAIFKRFGLGNLADELLVANGGHNLGNLVSLSLDMRLQFDSFRLWFEAATNVVRYQ